MKTRRLWRSDSRETPRFSEAALGGTCEEVLDKSCPIFDQFFVMGKPMFARSAKLARPNDGMFLEQRIDVETFLQDCAQLTSTRKT